MSDQELIIGVKNGDETAKRSLVDKYYPEIFDYSARINRDILRGEECITLAFRQVFEEIESGSDIKNLYIRMLQAVYRESSDNMGQRNKEGSESELFTLDPEFLQADPQKLPNPSLLLHDSEIVELTWWVASKIEPAQYSALDLRFRQGLTSQEVASVLSIRLREVDALLDRAKVFLNDNVFTLLMTGRHMSMDPRLHTLVKGEKSGQPYYIPTSKVRNYVMRSDIYQKMADKYPDGLEIFTALSNARSSFGEQSKITNYLLRVEPETSEDSVEPETSEDSVEPETSGDNVEPETSGDNVQSEIPPENEADETQGFSRKNLFPNGNRLRWIAGVVSIISLLSLIVVLVIDSNSNDVTLEETVVTTDPDPLPKETMLNVESPEFNAVKFTSSSHNIGEPSDVMRITIRWDYTDETSSDNKPYTPDNIRGYSFFWDSKFDSLPDRIIDIDQTVVEVISPVLAFGEWWFHIMSVDSDGNWSTPVHNGPYVLENPVKITLENKGSVSTKLEQDSDIGSETQTVSSLSGPLEEEDVSSESIQKATQITDEKIGLDVSAGESESGKSPLGEQEKQAAKAIVTDIPIEPPRNDKQIDKAIDENNGPNIPKDVIEQSESVPPALADETEEGNDSEEDDETVIVEVAIVSPTVIAQSPGDVSTESEENLHDLLDTIVPMTTSGRNAAMLPPIPNFFSGTVNVTQLIDYEDSQIVATIGDYGSESVIVEDGSYKLLLIDPLSNVFYGKEITFWLITDDEIMKAKNSAVFEEGNLTKGTNSIFRTMNLEFGPELN